METFQSRMAAFLLQGVHYTPVTRGHLQARSNGPGASIVYEVTRSPENGSLLWVQTERRAVNFTQDDVDNERIIYNQVRVGLAL